MPDNISPDVSLLPALRGLHKLFGDLSPRLHLVILHNLFFAVPWGGVLPEASEEVIA